MSQNSVYYNSYSIIIRSCPFFIASPSFTSIFFTFPETDDYTSFISFIASTIHNVCPSLTLSPSLMKGADVGDGAL